jgi:hypothetical protein
MERHRRKRTQNVAMDAELRQYKYKKMVWVARTIHVLVADGY